MNAIGRNVVTGRIVLLLSLALFGGLGAAGCHDIPADEATAPAGPGGPDAPATDQTYSIAITVATQAALPRCTASLSGQVGFVTSNSTLWSCSAGSWHEINCTI